MRNSAVVCQHCDKAVSFFRDGDFYYLDGTKDTVTICPHCERELNSDSLVGFVEFWSRACAVGKALYEDD